jgi:nicotinamidase-related amidase
MTTALLIIDVQQGLFATEPPPANATMVINNINQLSSWARSQQLPVIFVMHEKPDSVLAYQSTGWQLPAAIEQQPGDLISRKTTPDAFLRTELQPLLQSLAVDQLIICGYASEFCVDTTVRKAAALGYPVMLVADAHTTHDKTHASAAIISAHHNATLPAISSFGVRIQAVATAELLARNC